MVSPGVTLVTGGAGFIGSYVVDAVLAQGEQVRVLDNLDPLAHASGHAERLSSDAELIVGDLRDRPTVDAALEGVDHVYHLGGVVGNGESMVNVHRAVDTNSLGTATLLEAMVERRDAVRRIVVASSMVVYGEGAYSCAEHGELDGITRTEVRLAERLWEPICPICGAPLEPVPIREEQRLRPSSVYGITKRDQEELCLVVARAYGIEAVALRYLNTYGPGQALANPYTGVAAIFAARILAGRAPRIFEDGRQIRDLVHVRDVARATVAAMHAPEADGEAINVASGEPVTIADLATRLTRALGSDLEPEITGEFRVGDIRHCLADTRRAQSLLGFQATIDRDAGLAELAGWVSEQRTEEHGDQAAADLRNRGLLR